MKIVVRADSGTHIGTGHIMRCLTLAHAFKKSGHEVVFVTRNHLGNISSRIKKEFECIVLPDGVKDLSQYRDDEYSTWLGIPVEQEISEFRKISKEYGPFDLSIIDHYSLDEKFEREITDGKTLVIDDLMNRNHCCDYLLDQNLSASRSRYIELSHGKECHFFLGPKYALLREEFTKYRPIGPKEFTEVKRVFVFFGGSDITCECRKVVDAFLSLELKLNIDVVLPKDHEDYQYIDSCSGKDERINLFSFVSNMAEMIAKADICFGAAGTTSWERACLAVPSFIVAVAENQKIGARNLSSSGVSSYVGDGKITDVNDWGNVFKKLSDHDALNTMSSKAFKTCDGLGVNHLLGVFESA